MTMIDRSPDADGNNRAVPMRRRWPDLIWKCIGAAALVASLWILYRDLDNLSFKEIGESLRAIEPLSFTLAAVSTVTAYILLGFYDRLALAYLRKTIDPVFVHFCAAATYAFAHTIGASVFSGAVVRYRAYTSKGLSPEEVATLVIFCTLTFALGILTVLGAALTFEPLVADRFLKALPLTVSAATGKVLLAIAALYALVAVIPSGRLRLRSLTLSYPKFSTAVLQIAVSSLEILAAASIIYLVLPKAYDPGFVVVAGIFAFSFAAALLSHSPGGLGVFELTFLTGLDDIPRSDVLAALLIFRLYYLLVPFILSLVLISRFEIKRHG